jgi:hypothetical protein
MNPFASEPSQAALEEVEHVHTAPDRTETETLGSSAPGDGAPQRDPARPISVENAADLGTGC